MFTSQCQFAWLLTMLSLVKPDLPSPTPAAWPAPALGPGVIWPSARSVDTHFQLSR